MGFFNLEDKNGKKEGISAPLLSESRKNGKSCFSIFALFQAKSVNFLKKLDNFDIVRYNNKIEFS